MKLVIISDTHGRHDELGILRGDGLIHCGDSGNGFSRERDDVDGLDAWFGRQEFERILCIGGNHDFDMQARAERGGPVLRNAEYLQDQVHEYRSVRFYGSPWTPELVDWAYYLDDDELRARWELIPNDVEILITHTPPYGVLDRNTGGRNCGCRELPNRLLDLHPRIHCFGHIHASAGTTYEWHHLRERLDGQPPLRDRPPTNRVQCLRRNTRYRDTDQASRTNGGLMFSRLASLKLLKELTL